MKYFLLFFAVAAISFSNAQTSWCKPGAKWYYGCHGFLGSYDFAVVYSYEGDTVHNNKTYNIIRGKYYGKSLQFFPFKDTLVENYRPFLTRMENDVLYTPMGGRDTVADFNANIGDTWLLAPDCNWVRRTGTVTATGFHTYKSQNYRTVTCAFTFTYINTTTSQVVTDTMQVGFIDKVLLFGNWRNPFVSYCPRDPNILYDGDSDYFCGYEDSETDPLELNPNSYCWKVSGVTESFAEKRVKVYPNPAKEHIIVNFKGAATLRVFNAQSVLAHEIVLPESGEYKLNIKDYAPGIYFLRLQNHQGSSTAKFIKE